MLRSRLMLGSSRRRLYKKLSSTVSETYRTRRKTQIVCNYPLNDGISTASSSSPSLDGRSCVAAPEPPKYKTSWTKSSSLKALRTLTSILFLTEKCSEIYSEIYSQSNCTFTAGATVGCSGVPRTRLSTQQFGIIVWSIFFYIFLNPSMDDRI